MHYLKALFKNYIAQALREFAQSKGIEFALEDAAVIAEDPPRPELGDIGFPMFSYAKALRLGPPQIASAIAAALEKNSEATRLATLKPEGPYLNVFFIRPAVLKTIFEKPLVTETVTPLTGQKITIEFSSPNTNKPLHLGHLRNDILGESLARILKAAGAKVHKTCIFNDRGVHICKSMLAYQHYAKDSSPASEGLKGDHFVGKYYVLFNQLLQENSHAEREAQNMLLAWENGNSTVRALWDEMRTWVLEGIRATYTRTGISFDSFAYESETYRLGVNIVREGQEKNVFYKEEDGSVWADFEDVGMDKKVFLRKDGTSLYITQDLGTIVQRKEKMDFDRFIYVVGNEQIYHFKVLFETIKRLGHPWAENLFHLSYGMVNLPSGRMKTREGTVVDADTLLDEVKQLAIGAITEKGRENAVGDLDEVAEKIALGAIHYYLLQVSPSKDMLFDPEASLSFTGNTGPYIQYMAVRAKAIMNKFEKGEGKATRGSEYDASLLTNEGDWALIKILARWEDSLALAAQKYDPFIVGNYLYELASNFASWYRENPVLNCPDAGLARARLELVRRVHATLCFAMELLVIPVLEAM